LTGVCCDALEGSYGLLWGGWGSEVGVGGARIPIGCFYWYTFLDTYWMASAGIILFAACWRGLADMVIRGLEGDLFCFVFPSAVATFLILRKFGEYDIRNIFLLTAISVFY